MTTTTNIAPARPPNASELGPGDRWKLGHDARTRRDLQGAHSGTLRRYISSLEGGPGGVGAWALFDDDRAALEGFLLFMLEETRKSPAA